MNEPMPEGKSYVIPKQVVWEAWLKVKKKGGAAGADGVTIGQFEERVKGEKDWVVDMDVKAFFDSVSWDLALKAVARHTDRKWVLLYVERWLKAPMRMPDGTLTERTQGTPQGGLCSAERKPP